MRKAIVGFMVAGALLVVAGCGDDSSTISKEEYDQRLEVACNKGIQEREELTHVLNREFEEKLERDITRKIQEENLRKLIAVYQRTTEAIADIPLPEGEAEKTAEEYVREREDAAAKVEAAPIAANNALFKKSEELGEELESVTCGF